MFSDPEWILVYFLRLSHRLHLFSFWQIYQGLINLLWEGNSSQLSSSLGFRFSKIQKSLSWFLSSRYLNFGYFFVLVVLKEDQGIKLKPELVSSGRTLKQVVEQTNSYRISQLEFLTAYTTGRPCATWELHRLRIWEERAKQTVMKQISLTCWCYLAIHTSWRVELGLEPLHHCDRWNFGFQ